MLMLALISSCGGGSGNNSNSNSSPNNNDPVWTLGQFDNADEFKDFCEIPRTGIDSFSGVPYLDEPGSSMHEKLWLRSWSDDTYLWYSEIDDINPASFTVANYFNQLKTNQKTVSGADKDNFHFTQSTQEYNELSQNGVNTGYGISWQFVSDTRPRKIVVAYVEPNSPASEQGIMRGFELQQVDNIDVVNTQNDIQISQINLALSPTDVGASHVFSFLTPDNNVRDIALVSIDVAIETVQNVAVFNISTDKIGYMQFNSYIQSGQSGLIDAFEQFSDENISELVIDLRYNGGGLLAMASQLAYMVAGSAQTNNLIFETSRYNDKSPTFNPVTNDRIQATPFYDREIDWDNFRFTNNTLPSVNLSRVFVLTTPSTCSASEAFINGLRGINIDVIQIGGSTCGKPYGFFPQDNCGTTYFTIQFQGENEKGFGEYSDGFKPSFSPVFDDEIKGCAVIDDFDDTLGDVSEALLAAALDFTQTGNCPAQAASMSKVVSFTNRDGGKAISKPNVRLNSHLLENKIYTPIMY
jgi:C-terminal processing protease CtpA/Prc